MNNQVIRYSPQHRFSAWLVHLFTASGAILGLFTLYMTYRGNFLVAFWLMAATISIDSIDGSMARFIDVKQVVPQIDGALLDNIVDYLNYVITPAFFILVSHILPAHWEILGASVMVLASAYQFTQADAKTSDHFFKGFPSYWNLVVFYLFIGHLNHWINLSIVTVLAILIFIPIKYVYLTRLDYVTTIRPLKALLILATIAYAAASIGLLISYPQANLTCVIVSWMFGLIYLIISLYRTFVPMGPCAKVPMNV